jgi:hypothetical protein
VLAALWLVPIVARAAGGVHIPLGIVVMLAAFAVTVLDRRHRIDPGSSAAPLS